MPRLFLSLAPAGGGLTVEGLMSNPVVPEVSIISEGPAKGHSTFDANSQEMVPVWVDAQTLESVATCCSAYSGGVRVNAGHFTGVLEAAGVINNPRIDGTKLRGDLTLFRTFSQFEHLCTVIATIPDTFGLSIDFEGESEIRDGKAFARCSQIYSCDLVPTPAANEGGLFSSKNDAATLTHIRKLLDISQPSTLNSQLSMADDNTPAPTASPDPQPPVTNNVVSDEVKAAILAAVTAAVAGAIDPLKTELAGITQRLTSIEAAQQADAVEDVAEDSAPTPMQALRKEFRALQSQIGEQSTKLARRFGLEFAARAGANPVENPVSSNAAASGDKSMSRSAFNALPAMQRSEFARNGGRITD